MLKLPTQINLTQFPVPMQQPPPMSSRPLAQKMATQQRLAGKQRRCLGREHEQFLQRGKSISGVIMAAAGQSGASHLRFETLNRKSMPLTSRKTTKIRIPTTTAGSSGAPRMLFLPQQQVNSARMGSQGYLGVVGVGHQRQSAGLYSNSQAGSYNNLFMGTQREMRNLQSYQDIHCQGRAQNHLQVYQNQQIWPLGQGREQGQCLIENASQDGGAYYQAQQPQHFHFQNNNNLSQQNSVALSPPKFHAHVPKTQKISLYPQMVPGATGSEKTDPFSTEEQMRQSCDTKEVIVIQSSKKQVRSRRGRRGREEMVQDAEIQGTDGWCRRRSGGDSEGRQGEDRGGQGREEVRERRARDGVDGLTPGCREGAPSGDNSSFNNEDSISKMYDDMSLRPNMVKTINELNNGSSASRGSAVMGRSQSRERTMNLLGGSKTNNLTISEQKNATSNKKFNSRSSAKSRSRGSDAKMGGVQIAHRLERTTKLEGSGTIDLKQSQLDQVNKQKQQALNGHSHSIMESLASLRGSQSGKNIHNSNQKNLCLKQFESTKMRREGDGARVQTFSNDEDASNKKTSDPKQQLRKEYQQSEPLKNKSIKNMDIQVRTSGLKQVAQFLDGETSEVVAGSERMTLEELMRSQGRFREQKNKAVSVASLPKSVSLESRQDFAGSISGLHCRQSAIGLQVLPGKTIAQKQMELAIEQRPEKIYIKKLQLPSQPQKQVFNKQKGIRQEVALQLSQRQKIAAGKQHVESGSQAVGAGTASGSGNNGRSQSPLSNSRGFTQPFLPVSHISQAFENIKPLCIEMDFDITNASGQNYKSKDKNSSAWGMEQFYVKQQANKMRMKQQKQQKSINSFNNVNKQLDAIEVYSSHKELNQPNASNELLSSHANQKNEDKQVVRQLNLDFPMFSSLRNTTGPGMTRRASIKSQPFSFEKRVMPSSSRCQDSVKILRSEKPEQVEEHQQIHISLQKNETSTVFQEDVQKMAEGQLNQALDHASNFVGFGVINSVGNTVRVAESRNSIKDPDLKQKVDSVPNIKKQNTFQRGRLMNNDNSKLQNDTSFQNQQSMMSLGSNKDGAKTINQSGIETTPNDQGPIQQHPDFVVDLHSKNTGQKILSDTEAMKRGDESRPFMQPSQQHQQQQQSQLVSIKNKKAIVKTPPVNNQMAPSAPNSSQRKRKKSMEIGKKQPQILGQRCYAPISSQKKLKETSRSPQKQSEKNTSYTGPMSSITKRVVLRGHPVPHKLDENTTETVDRKESNDQLVVEAGMPANSQLKMEGNLPDTAYIYEQTEAQNGGGHSSLKLSPKLQIKDFSPKSHYKFSNTGGSQKHQKAASLYQVNKNTVLPAELFSLSKKQNQKQMDFGNTKPTLTVSDMLSDSRKQLKSGKKGMLLQQVSSSSHRKINTVAGSVVIPAQKCQQNPMTLPLSSNSSLSPSGCPSFIGQMQQLQLKQLSRQVGTKQAGNQQQQVKLKRFQPPSEIGQMLQREMRREKARTRRSNRDLLLKLKRNPSRFLVENNLVQKSRGYTQFLKNNPIPASSVGTTQINANIQQSNPISNFNAQKLIDTEISSLIDKANDDLGHVGVEVTSDEQLAARTGGLGGTQAVSGMISGAPSGFIRDEQLPMTERESAEMAVITARTVRVTNSKMVNLGNQVTIPQYGSQVSEVFLLPKSTESALDSQHSRREPRNSLRWHNLNQSSRHMIMDISIPRGGSPKETQRSAQKQPLLYESQNDSVPMVQLEVTQSNSNPYFDPGAATLSQNGFSFHNNFVDDQDLNENNLHYQVAINKDSMRQGVIKQKYRQRQALFINRYDQKLQLKKIMSDNKLLKMQQQHQKQLSSAKSAVSYQDGSAVTGDRTGKGELQRVNQPLSQSIISGRNTIRNSQSQHQVNIKQLKSIIAKNRNKFAHRGFDPAQRSLKYFDQQNNINFKQQNQQLSLDVPNTTTISQQQPFPGFFCKSLLQHAYLEKPAEQNEAVNVEVNQTLSQNET